MPDAVPATDLATVELRSLIAHAKSLPADTTVEKAQQAFARAGVAFLAALDGERLLGVCARRELDQALGSRYGFALNAQRPLRDHLMEAPLRVVTDTPLTEVFKATSSRADHEFFDDVLLVDPAGSYVGLIAMRTLVRLQTDFLLSNIDHLEASRRVIADKNREMESDLAMAREVQLALLPPTNVPFVWERRQLQLGHRYQPAGGVSGDFFDVLRISPRTVGLVVCDVMGHGVRSALITAMVRAMLEELRPDAANPGALLTRLNRDLTRILRQTGELIFVTAAYAVISLDEGVLRYAQAGHPTALRWDAGTRTVRPVTCPPDCAGPALGLIDEFEFATNEEPFVPGDRLVLFTDGLFEAANAAGEEFGLDRLAQVVAANAGESLDTALAHSIEQVSRFCQGAPFGDDLCLLAAELAEG